MNLATGIVYKDSWIANTVSEYDQFCNQQQHEGKQELIYKYISILLFHSYTSIDLNLLIVQVLALYIFILSTGFHRCLCSFGCCFG